MANINQHWRRGMAVGCSHGALADPYALSVVHKFADQWNPHTRVHLGDYLDTTTWRHGAKGTPDEKQSVQDDLKAGLQFLKDYRPDILLNGNHDYRIWEHLHHNDAKLKFAAKWAITEIRKVLSAKCQFIETYNVNDSYVTLGDAKFMHGWMYSANGIQEHAEQFGKCVIAHLHIVGAVPGRHFSSPTGHCVGYLGDRRKFTYAERNRSMSRWANGFAWFEYTSKDCVIWLARRNETGPWRLPL